MTATELAEQAVEQIKRETSAKFRKTNRAEYRRQVKQRIRSIGKAEGVPFWVIWLAIQLFIWWFFE